MLPVWSSLHPLVVHFPVALLLFSFLLTALSRTRAPWSRAFVAPAMLALVLGVASAWLAVATGHAAVHRTGNLPDEIFAVVERHEELAETTAWLFSAVAALQALSVAVPALRAGTARPRLRAGLLVLLLVLYLAGACELVRTAHLGGQLVHRHGVRAKL